MEAKTLGVLVSDIKLVIFIKVENQDCFSKAMGELNKISDLRD